jgi:hypothetical protein
MKVYVLHDEAGEIRSIIHLEQGSEGTGAPVMPGEGETVTEIPAEGDAVELSPLDIHEHFRFDVKRGRLVRKRAAKKA